MRTITDPVTGVTINYPDALAFAFNPFLVEASNVDALTVIITLNGQIRYTIDAQPFGGLAYIDAQEYIQSLFDGMDLTVDYAQQMSESAQGIEVNISVTATTGNDEFATGFSSYVVWGAVKPDGRDNFRAMRRVCWFRNYPFIFGLYAEAGTSVLFGYEQAPHSAAQIGADSIYNFNTENLAQDAQFYVIYEYDGVIQQATFDNTFDLTFYLAQNVEQRPLLRIDVEDTADEGIYLRWIDRHGYWAHWLFKPGAEQRNVSALTEFSRNAFVNYDARYGWQRGAGRRQSMARADVVPLAVPLVDKDTFDYLQDVTTSPVVEMFAGYENGVPKWVGVGIQPGTYTKTIAELQDFVCNMIAPSTPIQSL